VLASHLISGTHDIEPDQVVREAIAGSPGAVAFVYLLVCVDRHGQPEHVDVLAHSRGHDSYLQAIKATAGDVELRW
jgi:hypothetical protein